MIGENTQAVLTLMVVDMGADYLVHLTQRQMAMSTERRDNCYGGHVTNNLLHWYISMTVTLVIGVFGDIWWHLPDIQSSKYTPSSK